jgi:hypothetical protein
MTLLPAAQNFRPRCPELALQVSDERHDLP